MNGLAQPASPLSMSSVAQLTLSLVAIVALIYAISWFLKRARLTAPRSRGQITILDELTLSPRDRVVLLRVGDSQLLVGIGAAGVVDLKPLTAPVALNEPFPTPAFADRMREFMKRSGSSR